MDARSQKDPKDPKSVPVRMVMMRASDLKNLPTAPRPAGYGVPEKDREGVYAHSFVCNACGLHFNVYSWQANRHRSENVHCPECGATDGFVHWRAVLSEAPTMQANWGHGHEVFHLCPYPRARLLDDSTSPRE
jgi:predicted RNA-binding Zn-ribbon protein involved in translation (DUF1610 family)